MGCPSISSLISASKNYVANQINENQINENQINENQINKSSAQPVNSETENPKSIEIDLTSVLSSSEKENTKMSESEMFGQSNNVSPEKSKNSAAAKAENTKMSESEMFEELNKVSPEKSKNSREREREATKISESEKSLVKSNNVSPEKSKKSAAVIEDQEELSHDATFTVSKDKTGKSAPNLLESRIPLATKNVSNHSRLGNSLTSIGEVSVALTAFEELQPKITNETGSVKTLSMVTFSPVFPHFKLEDTADIGHLNSYLKTVII